VGERENVLAVPNAALRTQRDVGSAAEVLGLSAEKVQRELASQVPGGRAGSAATGAGGQVAMGGSAVNGSAAADTQRAGGQAAGGRDTTANTRRGNGRTLVRGGGRTRSADPSSGGRYIVFVKRAGGPEAVWIRTGLTDLDYSEVVEGLQATDSVLILPSASLVQSQQESRERINRITGGGGLPGMQQQQQQRTTSPGANRAPGGR
jgi:hypothetical protein